MPSADRANSDYSGGDKKLARQNGMMSQSMDELTKREQNNPYIKDPRSMDTYNSIAQVRTQQMMRKVPPKLEAYGKHHGALLGQQSHMTYQDLLMGMFLDDEVLVPVRPLMIANYRMCDATTPGWPVEDEKFGLRLFLTNKRIFFLDADLHQLPTLDRDAQEIKENFWLVDRLKCTYRTNDELYYYPIPLTNVTGMTLDIHYQTLASGWLYGSRPYWAGCTFLLGVILAMLGTLEALIEWGTIQRLIGGTDGAWFPVVVSDADGVPSALNDTHTYEWDNAKYKGDFFAGLDQRQALTLVIGYVALCIGPWFYYTRKSYSRSQFRPKMKQRRQILLGVRTHAILTTT